MKKYLANPLINVPRWLETVIHCILFLLALLLGNFIGVNKGIEFSDFVNFTESGYKLIFLDLLLFYSMKLLGNHTAVDSVVIDNENRNVKAEYWLYYLIKRRITIGFDEMSFKNKNDNLIMGGFSLRLYQNGKHVIKLNSRNGWRSRQIDEIISELVKIKPPIKPLVERPTWR